jgi:hypothetical protein
MSAAEETTGESRAGVEGNRRMPPATLGCIRTAGRHGMQIGRPRRLPIYHWRNGYKIGRPATKIDGISDGTRAYHTELNYWFY